MPVEDAHFRVRADELNPSLRRQWMLRSADLRDAQLFDHVAVLRQRNIVKLLGKVFFR